MLGSEIVLVNQRNQCDPVPLSDQRFSPELVQAHDERGLIFQLVVGVCGAGTEGEGSVSEVVVLMRGEVRLDRDAAVFGIVA